MKYLSLILIFLTVTAGAQVLEEALTLESLYESRARAILNTMIRPNEYSVVVSAELNRDTKKLEKYREDVDVRFLPGMPMPGSPEMSPDNNVLHELKSSVAVNVVLDDKISVSKEEILKRLLTSKLKLDKEGGDTLTVSRMNLVLEAPERPSLLPDLSWRAWTLVAVLFIALLAALVFWRHKRSQQGKDSEQKLTTPNPLDWRAHPAAESEEEAGSAGRSEAEIAEQERRKKQDLMVAEGIRISELIMSLASGFPSLCAQALALHVSEGKTEEVTVLCDYLGWDVSRKLFFNLNNAIWSKLGLSLKDRTADPDIETVLKNLVSCYRAMLAKVLELGGEHDEENPFAFILKLTDSDRGELLQGESDTNLAILSLFLTPEQSSDTIKAMPLNRSSKILAEMARLEKLPSQAVQSAARVLSTRLLQIRNEGFIRTEGPRVVANVLRSLPADVEIDFLEDLTQNHPTEANKLRRERLQFMDLIHVPKDIMSKAMEAIDADIITQALAQTPATFVAQFSEFLPAKKANMILMDLQTFGTRNNRLEIGTSRRRLLESVEGFLKAQNMTLEKLLGKAVGLSIVDDGKKVA